MNVLLAEEVANIIPGEPWMYGVGALTILCALMYVVTRYNPKR